MEIRFRADPGACDEVAKKRVWKRIASSLEAAPSFRRRGYGWMAVAVAMVLALSTITFWRPDETREKGTVLDAPGAGSSIKIAADARDAEGKEIPVSDPLPAQTTVTFRVSASAPGVVTLWVEEPGEPGHFVQAVMDVGQGELRFGDHSRIYAIKAELGVTEVCAVFAGTPDQLRVRMDGYSRKPPQIGDGGVDCLSLAAR